MYLVWPLACIVVVVVASNKKNLRRGEANSRGRAHLRRESGPAMTRALSGEHTFQRGSGHWPKRKTTGLLRRCFPTELGVGPDEGATLYRGKCKLK